MGNSLSELCQNKKRNDPTIKSLKTSSKKQTKHKNVQKSINNHQNNSYVMKGFNFNPNHPKQQELIKYYRKKRRFINTSDLNDLNKNNNICNIKLKTYTMHDIIFFSCIIIRICGTLLRHKQIIVVSQLQR